MRRTYAFDTWREWITEAQALHRASQHPDLDAEDGGAVCRAAIVAISAAFEAYVEVLAETSGAALGERTYTDLEKAVLKFHNPRPEHIDNLLGACGWTCEVIRDMWHETDSRLGRRRGSVRDDIDAHQDDRHWVAHAQRLVEVSPGDVAERISDFSGVVASLDQFIGRAVEEETERPIWATQRDAEGDMRPARRLAELTRFLEDRSLLEVAQLAADALAGLSPEELQQLRDAPGGEAGAPYADLYDIYWNEWVEPQAPHSVNADYEGDHAELVLWMSYQGVVIDHLIRLRMEPADMWWDRATDLVAHHPAQPFPIN